MPKQDLSGLIVFGDSMSDIGTKRAQKMGRIARGLGLMRTNEVGRFSDGRNWTDFLWERTGGHSLVRVDQKTSLTATNVHRSLTKDSILDSPPRKQFYYCNYAEGGAMGASDHPKLGLGTFVEQVNRYAADCSKFDFSGHTLHIIWFGLNDLVTNPRPPESMWKVVQEIGHCMNKIDLCCKGRAHFMVVNIPSPIGAVRTTEVNNLAAAGLYHKGAEMFNEHLRGRIANYYGGDGMVAIIDMFLCVEDINNNLSKYELEPEAQRHGIPVNYGGRDSCSQRKRVATSDKAHPTEAVYRLMAEPIIDELITRYNLGNLTDSPPP